jgi:hypothetical protein
LPKLPSLTLVIIFKFLASIAIDEIFWERVKLFGRIGKIYASELSDKDDDDDDDDGKM